MVLLDQLTVITDELTQDFRTALNIASSIGLKTVEIRKIWNKNIALFTDEELQRLKNHLNKKNMNVSVVASPFGKCVLPSSIWATNKNASLSMNPNYNMSYFDRIVEISDFFNTPYIRFFNFLKMGPITEKKWREMITLLKPYADKAKEKKKILVLENESVCFSDTIANTIRFLNEIDSPAVKLNLDPGNFFSMHQPTTPEAYEVFYTNGWVQHMHIKDARTRILKLLSLFDVVGTGKIDYKALIQQAVDHDYTGYFSLETHANSNLMQKSVDSLKYLKNIIDELDSTEEE
ncbi:MAG: sugar phosphate isomerase/epimerase [Candidatus Lokiarchaeota archaeon]|nr:sugar phosphate isomerase/epimerase [Candidatus Lokiarchaeota archaeon]